MLENPKLSLNYRTLENAMPSLDYGILTNVIYELPDRDKLESRGP